MARPIAILQGFRQSGRFYGCWLLGRPDMKPTRSRSALGRPLGAGGVPTGQGVGGNGGGGGAERP